MRPATEKQKAFIIRLRDERALAPHLIERVNTRLAGDLDMATATLMIDYLLQHPLKEQPNLMEVTGLDLRGLASGRYAVGGLLVKVDNLTEAERGRWAGWVFVKNGSEYVDERFGSQAPGGPYRGEHSDLLGVILDDPLEAMKAYGKLTGTCAVCGRTLEDEVSVARGIGPVCWERVA